jgi:hypothetical protein
MLQEFPLASVWLTEFLHDPVGSARIMARAIDRRRAALQFFGLVAAPAWDGVAEPIPPGEHNPTPLRIVKRAAAPAVRLVPLRTAFT